jgi:hypothetical protein
MWYVIFFAMGALSTMAVFAIIAWRQEIKMAALEERKAAAELEARRLWRLPIEL